MDSALIETPLMWIDKADTWALAHQREQSGIPNGGQALVDRLLNTPTPATWRPHAPLALGCGGTPGVESGARRRAVYAAVP
jgi:7-cyano-7-deazaguanine synthase in queuosine biosynthesis